MGLRLCFAALLLVKILVGYVFSILFPVFHCFYSRILSISLPCVSLVASRHTLCHPTLSWLPIIPVPTQFMFCLWPFSSVGIFATTS